MPVVIIKIIEDYGVYVGVHPSYSVSFSFLDNVMFDEIIAKTQDEVKNMYSDCQVNYNYAGNIARIIVMCKEKIIRYFIIRF